MQRHWGCRKELAGLFAEGRIMRRPRFLRTVIIPIIATCAIPLLAQAQGGGPQVPCDLEVELHEFLMGIDRAELETGKTA